MVANISIYKVQWSTLLPVIIKQVNTCLWTTELREANLTLEKMERSQWPQVETATVAYILFFLLHFLLWYKEWKWWKKVSSLWDCGLVCVFFPTDQRAGVGKLWDSFTDWVWYSILSPLVITLSEEAPWKKWRKILPRGPVTSQLMSLGNLNEILESLQKKKMMNW